MDLSIEKIVDRAIQQSATDIHLVAGYPIVFRILGKLTPMSEALLTPENLQLLSKSLCSEKSLAELHHQNDTDFGLNVNGVRLRVNGHVQKGSIAFSIRLIMTEVPSIDTLGLPSIMKNLAVLPQGLILVTGPTGHGKSTTQAALIRHIIETRNAHIITIEDPIEYVFSAPKTSHDVIIEQREIGIDTPTFALALKHVLRQDPNVIFIGEMRDPETIATALTAAETGHLVLSTLHTLDAGQSVDRIIDAFPSQQQNQIRTQLSMVLEGIFSIRLFPRADDSGLIAAVETLTATPAVRNLIRTQKIHEIYSMIEMGKEHGMQTLDDAIEQLIIKGLVRFEDAEAYIRKHERFKKHGHGEKNRAA